MQVVESKNRNKAVLGTLITHGALLAFLLLYTLVVPVPLPGDIDMELELAGGFIDAGGGGGGSSASTPAAAASIDEETPAEEIISSEVVEEEAPPVTQVVKPVVNTTKPNTTKPNTTTTKPNTTTTKPINQNALFPGIEGNGDGKGDGDGNGDGKGDGKGDGTGNGDGNGNGNGTGDGNKPGVYGNGDHTMTGRLLKFKPTITEQVQAAGRVVINIYVNRDGKVTRTSVNEQLTNTENKRLRDLALEAAKKTTWSAKDDAAFEQKGTITFKFTLN